MESLQAVGVATTNTSFRSELGVLQLTRQLAASRHNEARLRSALRHARQALRAKLSAGESSIQQPTSHLARDDTAPAAWRVDSTPLTYASGSAVHTFGEQMRKSVKASDNVLAQATIVGRAQGTDLEAEGLLQRELRLQRVAAKALGCVHLRSVALLRRQLRNAVAQSERERASGVKREAALERALWQAKLQVTPSLEQACTEQHASTERSGAKLAASREETEAREAELCRELSHMRGQLGNLQRVEAEQRADAFSARARADSARAEADGLRRVASVMLNLLISARTRLLEVQRYSLASGVH